jgi:predicted SnoaL-like aldol condensation-catalyzing enzyme
MYKVPFKKLFNHAAAVGMLLGLSACQTTELNTMTNQEKAVAVIESIETGNPEAISYINPNTYIQHNLAVADGPAGFGALLQLLPEGSAKAKVKRAFQDDNFVVLHTEYNFFGPKVGFDVFRFEDGKIVEHWDNLQELTPVNASGRTQTDGSTKVINLNDTEQNKALVADFVNTILINGDMTRINDFIGVNDEDYLQHNPAIGDGLNSLGKALASLAENGMPMIYKNNHKILGQGNFVLSISEGTFLNKDVAFYDLFRIENNKLVEHWDVIENIPAKAEWKNHNGKFNF